MRQISLKKNYIANLIKTIMLNVFPLISYPYATRILGTDGIGKVNYTSSIIGYFSLAASLGFSSYAIREGARIRDNKIRLEIFSKEILVLNMLSTAVSYICLFAFIHIPSFREYTLLLLVQSISIFATTLGVEWLYTIYENFVYTAIVSTLFQAASTVALFVFVKDSGDYLQYAVVLTLSTTGYGILNFIYSFRYINWFKKTSLSLLRHIKAICILGGLTIASNIYLSLDTVIIGFMLGDVQVGIYSTSVKINRIAGQIVAIFSTILFPRATYFLGCGKQKEYKRLINATSNYILMLCIPMSIGLILVSEEAFVLLTGGGDFLNGIFSNQILAINLIFSAIDRLFAYQILIPHNHDFIVLKATMIGAILNLFTNCIFIPIGGINSAAVTTLAAEICVFLILLKESSRLVKIIDLFKNTWEYFTACIPMVAICFGIRLLHFPVIVSAILMVFFGCISYFVFLYVLKNEYFCNLIRILYNKVR